MISFETYPNSSMSSRRSNQFCPHALSYFLLISVAFFSCPSALLAREDSASYVTNSDGSSPKDDDVADESDESRNDNRAEKKDPKLPLRHKKVSDLRPRRASPLYLADPYEIRKEPGPEHGGDPHGDDPHDEKHFDPYGGTTSVDKDSYGGTTSNNADHPNRPY